MHKLQFSSHDQNGQSSNRISIDSQQAQHQHQPQIGGVNHSINHKRTSRRE